MSGLSLRGGLSGVDRGDHIRIWQREKNIVKYEAAGYVIDADDKMVMLSIEHPLHKTNGIADPWEFKDASRPTTYYLRYFNEFEHLEADPNRKVEGDKNLVSLVRVAEGDLIEMWRLTPGNSLSDHVVQGYVTEVDRETACISMEHPLRTPPHFVNGFVFGNAARSVPYDLKYFMEYGYLIKKGSINKTKVEKPKESDQPIDTDRPLLIKSDEDKTPRPMRPDEQ